MMVSRPHKAAGKGYSQVTMTVRGKWQRSSYSQAFFFERDGADQCTSKTCVYVCASQGLFIVF